MISETASLLYLEDMLELRAHEQKICSAYFS